MCRLLGIVASEPTKFGLVLRDAPRSLAALAREHPDGWGLAVHESDVEPADWVVHKGVLCATDDEQFHRLAVSARGRSLIAHIRQRTVGMTCLDNTHPFQVGRWVFAHNGTLSDCDFIRAQIPAERLQALRGDTDSELLFAYLLNALEVAGCADGPPGARADAALADAVNALRSRSDIGSFNFLLSDGHAMYAHRFGRTLYLLERGPDDEVRTVRSSEDGTIVETGWSSERSALFVSSERLTDEPWVALDEGTLMRIDRKPSPTWKIIKTRPTPGALHAETHVMH